MDKTAVKDYLAEYSKMEFPELIDRELQIPLDEKFTISIVGPRRSGKTFYFYQLIKKKGLMESLYLNFEDTRLLDLSFKDFREVIRQYMELSGKPPKYLFFDEIQNIDKWEIAVRGLYDNSSTTYS